MFEESA